MKPSLALIPLCLMTLFLTGCAGLTPQRAQDPTAWDRARAIQSLNQDIKTSKGMAQITVLHGGKRQRLGMAWAAQAPNRARIILTASGQPIETIIADGKKVTFFSHTRAHAPHTTASADPDLTSLTHIPVKMSDLIAVLLGQIPTMDFDSAQVTSTTPLILKKKWGPRQQRLGFMPNGKIKKLECFTRENLADYTLLYKRWKSFQDHEIPKDFSIQGRQGDQMDILVLKFFPNVPIKEKAFRLTPTGS